MADGGSSLSEAQKATLKSIFESFDGDKDGKVTVEEFDRAMGALGLTVPEGKRPSEQTDLAKFLDFAALALSDTSAASEESLRSAFDRFDRNKNGVISMDELRSVLEAMDVLSKEQIELIMKDVKEEDGREVDFAEFKQLVLGKQD